jgi:dihydroxy-acid dehydratase
VVGHITPEAFDGGAIGLINDDDKIIIDATSNTINVILTDEEMAARKAAWKQPALKATKGLLYRYAKTVSSAAEGCVTDEMP